MHEGLYLGFDFGYKRIGVAVGQSLTGTARPIQHLSASLGIPQWDKIATLLREWQPHGLVVGLPTCIDGKSLYTTDAAKKFAQSLKDRFQVPVYLVDERLSTKEARAQLFEHGGYRQLQKGHIDSVAACVILEQWLQFPDEAHEALT